MSPQTCCFPVSPYRPIDFRISSTSLISGKHFIMNEIADMSSSNISCRCCKRRHILISISHIHVHVEQKINQNKNTTTGSMIISNIFGLKILPEALLTRLTWLLKTVKKSSLFKGILVFSSIANGKEHKLLSDRTVTGNQAYIIHKKII